ncbi:MAG: ComEA family DNA-binding protein [Peptococcaceae bacterium]
MFQLERRQQLIVLIIAALILFGGGYKYACWQKNRAAESKVTLEQLEAMPGEDEKGEEIVVHVTGAVEKSGVYRLPAGARINDALKKAGVQAEADLDSLNLAAPLIDGQKIIVPLRQENLGMGNPGGPFSSGPPKNMTSRETPAPGSGGLVNINTADQAALDSLPGIGPALAQRIIQYREKNGPYKVPEDIKNVSGIGEKRFENLKDLISVY